MSDDGLARLSGHVQREEIGLANTDITDAGLPPGVSVSLFSAADRQELMRAVPNLQIFERGISAAYGIAVVPKVDN